MSNSTGNDRLTPEELTLLKSLGECFPNLSCALAEIARLSAELTLPKGTIHVISDVHGDANKLRHVLNNASGMLRPMVEKLFASEMREEEMHTFLSLVFYPTETLALFRAQKPEAEFEPFLFASFRRVFLLIRALTPRYTRERVEQVLPEDFRPLLLELLQEPSTDRGRDYYDELIKSMIRHNHAEHFLRLTVRVARNLALEELILDGDCWDRGHRGDKVVDLLMHQPKLTFIWGNHDAAWLGACLGHEALIAHVLRISCRYRRLAQLEEGYGINLQPLEKLIRDKYADDEATAFKLKNTGLRPEVDMRRMQKAAAIMQFKLEGQMIDRNPEWNLSARKLLHRLKPDQGKVEIDGKDRTLRDTNFPTIDPNNPYELSSDERECMDRIRESFLTSEKLWEHIKFLLTHGNTYAIRDDHLIFHACVPVDDQGEFLPMVVDGAEHKGKAIFDALDKVLARLTQRPSQKDLDLTWYLWCGARSPLFGKDRICTFEADFVEEEEAHKETKNPYFKLIHEKDFCAKILREFGADEARGLIVNGHVPVKIEEGEDPIKRSGMAITIDGAFSEAYGDHGYTLILEPGQTLLAEHHHFDSVEAAVKEGKDIIPKTRVVREWDSPRKVQSTERGEEIRRQIEWLEKLVDAYRTHQLRERRS